MRSRRKSPRFDVQAGHLGSGIRSGKRGCIAKSHHTGELDLEKAAMILLTDYRSGKLGRISLETPESRAAMLAAAKQSTVE